MVKCHVHNEVKGSAAIKIIKMGMRRSLLMILMLKQNLIKKI